MAHLPARFQHMAIGDTQAPNHLEDANTIRDYLQCARLPALGICRETPHFPSRDKKAHKNHLQCFFDNTRGLQCILRIKQTPVHLSIDVYSENSVSMTPTTSRLPPLNRDGILPIEHFRVPSKVMDVADVSKWVCRIPLATVQNIFYSEHPSKTDWRWIEVDTPDQDFSLMRTIHWTYSPSSSPAYAPNLIVFVQEPWVLGDRDFTHFTRMKSMPQAPRELTGKERLWAKIYDECTRNKCRWFIVTTYCKWSFGVFSEGFQAAFITLEIPTPRKWAPKVTSIQSIYYWLASCMGLPSTYRPESVMETPFAMQTRRKEQKRTSKRISFDQSDSESCSDSEDEMGNGSTYSNRILNDSESLLSFQSSNDAEVPLPGMLRNVRSAKKDEVINGGYRIETMPRLPVAGNMLTKEHQLPPRNYPIPARRETLRQVTKKRQQSSRKDDLLDWLEEEGLAPLGGSVVTTTRTGINTNGMNSNHNVPSSPSMSVVSTASSGAGLPLGAVGQNMFAVAPRKASRGKQYKI